MRRFGPGTRITGVSAANDDGGEFVHMARCFAATRGFMHEAAALAERTNGTMRVVDVLQKGVAPATVDDPAWAGAFVGDEQARISQAFVASLRNESAFYRLFNDQMMLILPVYTRIVMSTLNATGWMMGEARPVPLSRMSFAGPQGLRPRVAAALLVASEELLKASGREGEEAFGRELRRAIGLTVDQEFFALTVDEETPTIASAGADAEDALRDLRSLFAACNLKSESRPLLVCAAEVARGAATLCDLGGARVFPDMGPTGGEICDVPAMVSDAVPPGTVTLVDGAGIAGNVGRVTIDITNKVAIEMLAQDLVQNPDEGIGTELVDMWTNHLEAIMARANFAAHRLRPDATARLTGVAWGPDEAAS